jgi:PAS domain S-box-containing protein
VGRSWPATPADHARDQGTSRPAGGTQLCLRLLEERGSTYSVRIEQAAHEAGLIVQHLEAFEAVPADAALIGVGPSMRNPLDVARHLRRLGSHGLLVFFTASSSARDALQAELVRDPFLYSHFELIDVPDNPRQLIRRMGRVIANVEREFHAEAVRRRLRHRPRGARARPPRVVTGEQYLASLLAQTGDAMISTDDAGTVLTWNQAAEQLFGVSARQAVGQPVSVLDAADSDAEQLGTIVQRVLSTRAPEQAQITWRAVDGSSVRVAANVAPIGDSQGRLLGLSIIAADNAEYERIEEALRDANRQKDEFMAIMSHELRTPLTSILGYTDMLLRGLAGPLPPLTNKYIGNVRSAGDRLLELVNGLLDYTRLEAGVERLEVRPIDLAGLVGQAVQQCQAQARAKGIELRLAVGKGVAARVQADEDKLSHVLHSYLGNALKFTAGGGWVAVHLGPDPEAPDAVRVTVSDSGIGLRDEQLQRVWERFYQGDASLTRPYGGMGLGLSIARHLVTLHGGAVGAESRGPGLGSTFWFSLPLGHAR